jgi:hypothetical protein
MADADRITALEARVESLERELAAFKQADPHRALADRERAEHADGAEDRLTAVYGPTR